MTSVQCNNNKKYYPQYSQRNILGLLHCCFEKHIMQNVNSGGQNKSRNGNTKGNLELKNGTFRPYHKPDDKIQYIHTESNQILLNIH